MPLALAVDQRGILPDEMIGALIRDGAILAEYEFVQDQIQPASLDLRLGEIAFRVRASFLPGPNTTVAERIDDLKLHEIALTDGAVLETGCVYIVPLIESLALPRQHRRRRQSEELDRAARRVHPRDRRRDPRLRPHQRRLSRPALCRDQPEDVSGAGARGLAAVADPLPPRQRAAHGARRCARCTRASGWSTTTDADVGEGVAVSVDLGGLGPDGFVGYRAKRHTGLIDVDRRAGYDVGEFWEPIKARKDESLVLDPDEFYILASKEAVQVPPDYAAEMVPFDPLVGEFRVHYAGFFDPGFGYAGAGGRGARAVLEVRSREVPFILEHGQTVGRLVYEHMLERPKSLYGQGIGSNYQAQGLKLSKHFRT